MKPSAFTVLHNDVLEGRWRRSNGAWVQNTERSLSRCSSDDTQQQAILRCVIEIQAPLGCGVQRDDIYIYVFVRGVRGREKGK